MVILVEERPKELKKVLRPFQLWAIGVGLVISGHYFGWNFGLSSGGYWGMVIGTILMAIMYGTMVLCIAEMSTFMPHAGGPYSFARRAIGPLAGFLTGIGVILEYFLAAPVVAIGIGGYVNFLFPQVSSSTVAMIVYLIFVIIHIIGIKEYAILETIIVLIALGLLVILYTMGLPKVNTINLFGANGKLLPYGFRGIWACLPYGMWFFLAIEMLPMLSEECVDPKKDMPRGIISAMVTLVVMSFLTLTISTGIGGAELLGISGNPLPDAAARVWGKDFWLAKVLATVGILGLIASFSGVILGYSRQIFSLARAGYLPKFLSAIHPSRRTPYWALIVPSVLGFILVIFFNADDLILVATFGALVSYATMCVSFILLRIKEPHTERLYKVPGFLVTPCISLVLIFFTLFSSIFREWRFFVASVVIFFVATIYYFLWARHHIDILAPEEGSAVIEQNLTDKT